MCAEMCFWSVSLTWRSWVNKRSYIYQVLREEFLNDHYYSKQVQLQSICTTWAAPLSWPFQSLISLLSLIFFSRFSPLPLYTWERLNAFGIFPGRGCQPEELLILVHLPSGWISYRGHRQDIFHGWHSITYSGLSSPSGLGFETTSHCSGKSTPRLLKRFPAPGWDLWHLFLRYFWSPADGSDSLFAELVRVALCWGCSEMNDLCWAWSC